MATVVFPLSAFVINMWGLLFKKVFVVLEFSITCFWNVLSGVCFLFEKLFIQLTNFNLASLRSLFSILWIFYLKSAIRCFVGIFLAVNGMPKFLPKLIVFATTGGICVSVKLVNQESMRQQWEPISSLFKLFCAWMGRSNLDLQLFLCDKEIRSFIESRNVWGKKMKPWVYIISEP